jgi:hypothetical protein
MVKADTKPMTLCFALFTEPDLAGPLATQITAEWLARCAKAINIQLERDVWSYWPAASRSYMRVASSPGGVAPGEIAFAILSSLPDAPGAVAYHDINGDAVPAAFLGLDTCNSLDDVSIAISHEVIETVGDPNVNLWADDGIGSEWALELCDAVESNSYSIDLSDGQPPIRVSDFLLPSFFVSLGRPPYNFLASQGPSAPFVTASGGYQIKRSAGGGETEVTGEIPSDKTKRKMHWSSRTSRRLALRGR